MNSSHISYRADISALAFQLTYPSLTHKSQGCLCLSLSFSIPLTLQEKSIDYSNPSCQVGDPQPAKPPLPLKVVAGPAVGKLGHAPLGKEQAAMECEWDSPGL